MNRIFRDLLILLATIAITWLVFTLLIRDNSGDNNSKKEFSVISEENEKEVAQALRKNVFSQYDTIQNPVLQTAIDSIEQRLTKQSENEYNIYILQDSSVNAFATLQGDIFLFRGLIEYTSSPEMLSSVIAHEIGHIKNEHFVKRMSRQIGLQTVILIFTGGDAGTITQLTQNLLNMRYSREQEKEADKIALKKLEKSNINPQNLTRFFLKLNKRSSKYQEEYLELFMTHPSLKNRIHAATSYETGKDYHKTPIDLDWNKVQKTADYD